MKRYLLLALILISTVQSGIVIADKENNTEITVTNTTDRFKPPVPDIAPTTTFNTGTSLKTEHDVMETETMTHPQTNSGGFAQPDVDGAAVKGLSK